MIHKRLDARAGDGDLASGHELLWSNRMGFVIAQPASHEFFRPGFILAKLASTDDFGHDPNLGNGGKTERFSLSLEERAGGGDGCSS